MSKRSKNRSNPSQAESDSTDLSSKATVGSGVTSGKWLPLDELVEPDLLDAESLDPESLDAGEPSDTASPEEPLGGAGIKKVFERLVFTVEPEHANLRIDLYLTLKIDGYSRVFLRRVLTQGFVRVDGREVKPAFHVVPGQQIEVNDLPPAPQDGPIPEAIALDILYEDESIVAINKFPGMVVHPAKGHWSGTLTAALAHHFKQLSDAGGPTRPGIVHRLDRETSGVILIAKTNEVHYKLCAQFEARQVQKTYVAIVTGSLDRDRDRIIQPIGHHPYQREKMAIRSGHPSSRYAETQFEVTQRFPGYALLKVSPKTGRTHQIRLHLAHIGCPVLCDRLYGGHSEIRLGQLLRRSARGLPLRPEDTQTVLARHALHALEIEFEHPKTNKRLTIAAPLPLDMQRVVDILQQGDAYDASGVCGTSGA
ncbi:MAG: RluA family pseudouridine synthase [Planctomycetota bacterium]|nr:RluA family pseudouridine synthase [Planctomycetota bacterium]